IFFQAEDGIRDFHVTGVQTCALPVFKARFSLFTPTILGIISPPFSTYTVSPSCRSKRAISLAWCNDARFTVVPASRTGFRFATGVTAPVLPTWYAMLFKVVSARSALYL